MAEPSPKLARSTSKDPSIKSGLGYEQNEYDAASAGVNVLTRDVEDSEQHDEGGRRRKRRSCRAHCGHWRRLYIALGSILGLGLVAGVIYGIAVQVMWGRYDPSVYGRAHNLSSTQIWAHSHNDELQDESLVRLPNLQRPRTPKLTHQTLALHLGFSSIEIDTWYIPPLPNSFTNRSYLSIGHDEQYVRNGTLVEVYLAPILQLLDNLNPSLSNTNISSPTYTPSGSITSWTGLHPTDPSTTTQLVFDFKNAPESSYNALEWDLRRLRDRGYLTTYNTTSQSWTYGPLLIIITGDGPLPAVYHASARSIFYDGPLLSLDSPFSIPQSPWGPAVSGAGWTKEISPMASAKLPVYAQFAPVLPPPPRSLVTKRLGAYAESAEKKGIRARWWGASRGSRGTRWVRERSWSVLKESGVGWVGGDDLEEMAEWLKRYGG